MNNQFTVLTTNLEIVNQYSNNSIVRIIGPLDIDFDEISLSIVQVNGVALAKKYLLLEPAAMEGYKVYTYRLTQTDTAIANPELSNMKFTFTAKKDAYIATSNIHNVSIARTNIAQITIPEDSSLSGFVEKINDLSDTVDNLQVNVSQEYYKTDLASTYNRTFTSTTGDMVPLTRGTTPRYIQVQDLASSLAIVGPQGPGGEDGLDGAPGASGVGIIFRGVYSSSKTYTYDDLRRDAVLYNGIYYIAKVKYESTTGVFDVDAWEQFQGQFESVATNLLLTEDMAVTRSIVLGTENSNIGTLRSANASNINSGVGFYFDAEGNALIGNTSDNYIRWNGNTLEISGTIVQGTITDPLLLESLKGEPGEDGTNGADGDPIYLHIAYSNSSNGTVDFYYRIN